MANDPRRKARADTTRQPVATEVVACLAAHTGLPQSDFRTRRKIKRFAAGGKRRGALIRALLARRALKQLGLRQQDFDKAELSGKSTVGDIIGIITDVAKAAKTAKPPKTKAAKKRARAAGGTTQRPVKASKTATKKTKQVAASKPAKPVVRKSKAPKRAAKKTAPRGTDTAQKPVSAARGLIGRRATKAMIASKSRRDEDAEAAPHAEAPRVERAQRAPRSSKASRADAAGATSASGPEDIALEANVELDNRAELAAEPQASHVTDVLLRDADKDERLGSQPN